MTKLNISDRTRAYIGEVGTIVLGVLIALALGEVADAIRHRVNARRALAAVRLDIIDNTSTLEVRSILEQCERDRLTVLATELENARASGKLRDIGEIGSTPTRTYRTGNWDSASSNGDTLYMDQALVASLTDYHDTLSRFRVLRDEEGLNWARMSVLVHAPGPIDENTLSFARSTLAELSYQASRAATFSSSLFQVHKAMRIPVLYLPFNGHPQSRQQLIARIRNAPICQPLFVDGVPVSQAGSSNIARRPQSSTVGIVDIR